MVSSSMKALSLALLAGAANGQAFSGSMKLECGYRKLKGEALANDPRVLSGARPVGSDANRAKAQAQRKHRQHLGDVERERDGVG